MAEAAASAAAAAVDAACEGVNVYVRSKMKCSALCDRVVQSKHPYAQHATTMNT